MQKIRNRKSFGENEIENIKLERNLLNLKIKQKYSRRLTTVCWNWGFQLLKVDFVLEKFRFYWMFCLYFSPTSASRGTLWASRSAKFTQKKNCFEFGKPKKFYGRKLVEKKRNFATNLKLQNGIENRKKNLNLKNRTEFG